MNKTLCRALLLFFCLVFSRAILAAPLATVRTVVGRLSVQRRGAGALNASARTALNAGDIVRTGAGSRAELLFVDGSRARMNANASVEITARANAGRGKQSLLRIISGEVLARVRPNTAVRTRSATLGAVGTEFLVQVAPDDSTVVSVVEGTVDFFNEFGAVAVGASQQSIARVGQAPTAPITIPSAGFILEWSLDLNRAAIPREYFFATSDPTRARAQVPLAENRARATPQDFAARLAFGDALFDAHQFAESAREYEVAQKIEPARREAALHLGRARLELDELDEAERLLRFAATDDALLAKANVALAQLELGRDQLDAALKFARIALAKQPDSVPARIAEGLALMRRGDATEAAESFRAALAAPASLFSYQARAWLALTLLARGENDAALREAREAVRSNSASALAHGNFSLVLFFNNRPGEAVNEAKAATRLDADSVAARVALGQAFLARGDVDAAAREAARAVALDARLPQAHYLLGVADAQRGDFRHAVPSLRRSLELAPDFLPAATALAAVFNRQGRSADATRVLQEIEARRPDDAAVAAAFGEVLYEQGRYDQARARYRDAVRLNPTSALAFAGLARLAIDANRLNEAIVAGQKAVQLAPQIAQYHAVLGLAFDYARLEAQSEREFRTALALDPQNALALVQLGLRNQEGDARLSGRTAGLTFAQGFLLDPAISRQLMRGGVNSEIAPAIGPDNRGLRLQHRDVGADGDFHLFARASDDRDNGDRPNTDTRDQRARLDATFKATPKTNTYLHLLHQGENRGLRGDETTPATDDRFKLGFNEGIAAARHRVRRNSYLWAGLFANQQREERLNPNGDLSFARPVPFSLFPISAARVLNETTKSQALNPEVRLDLDLGQDLARPRLLTLGAARLHTRFRQNQSLVLPGTPLGTLAGNPTGDGDARAWLSYARIAFRPGANVSVSAQLRHLRLDQTTDARGGIATAGGLFAIPLDATQSTHRSRTLPSINVNWQANRSTSLRLLAGRRFTDVTGSIFAPTDTILASERETLPTGLPETVDLYELDIERRFANGVLKIFPFHASARNLAFSFSAFANSSDFNGDNVLAANSLQLGSVKRTGIGARFERQLNDNLFGFASIVGSRTTSRLAGSPFDGAQAPYHPRVAAALGLNYIDARGLKMGVVVNRTGSFFADTLASGARPQFPAKTSVDLTLARETSLRLEIFAQATNVFGARQIVANGIPENGRRVRFGVISRF